MSRAKIQALFLSIILGGWLFTSACSDRERLHEMHDATENINQETEKLVNSMSEVYDSGRQGTSLSLRREALDTMSRSQTMAGKLTEAALYFNSIEFQLWNSRVPGDTLERREVLFADAAEEFFAKILEYWVGVKEVDVLASETDRITFSRSKRKKEANFNALAAMMHYQNRKQVEMLSTHPHVEGETMYSIVKKALLKEKAVRAGEISQSSISKADHMILRSRTVAIQLLQARHNMLLLLAASKISPMGQAESVVDFLKTRLLTWELDFKTVNTEALNECMHYIDMAFETQELLSALGEPLDVNRHVAALWENMR